MEHRRSPPQAVYSYSPNSASEESMIRCPGCHHTVPNSNLALHRARCRARSPSPSPSPPRRVPRAAPEGLLHQQQAAERRSVVDLTESPNPSSSNVVDLSSQSGVADEDEEDEVEAMDGSPPPSSSSSPRLTSAAVGRRWRSPHAASSSFSSASSSSSSSSSSATTSSRPTSNISPPPQLKDDNMGAAGGEEQEQDEDVQISCQACTFANPSTVDLCQVCMTPLSSSSNNNSSSSLVGRMQQVGTSHNNNDDDDARHPPEACWTCPICTFASNRRGIWICQACEYGRPRAQDMMEWENEDGYVMVSPSSSRRVMVGRRSDGRFSAGSSTSASASGGGGGILSMDMRSLEDVLGGAFLGAGLGGAASALSGGSGSDQRRRMMQGMLMGGLGGAVFGSSLRDMMAMQQLQGQHIDPDRMSYEDMLNLFGPGHEPTKASAEATAGLPETRLTEQDVARMRRESTSDHRECSVCMEDFAVGDVMKRLPCTHCFHKACIDKWLTQCNGSCPVCKFVVT